MDSRITNTKYLVEATYEEGFNLWKTFIQEYKVFKESEWKTDSAGWCETVGELDNRPVVLTFWWAEIKGVLVCFYESNSQVVDWKMIEEWLAEHFVGVPKTNSTNFHICANFINDQ